MVKGRVIGRVSVWSACSACIVSALPYPASWLRLRPPAPVVHRGSMAPQVYKVLRGVGVFGMCSRGVLGCMWGAEGCIRMRMGAAWMNGGKVRGLNGGSVHLLYPRAVASPETRLGLGQGQGHGLGLGSRLGDSGQVRVGS